MQVFYYEHLKYIMCQKCEHNEDVSAKITPLIHLWYSSPVCLDFIAVKVMKNTPRKVVVKAAVQFHFTNTRKY